MRDVTAICVRDIRDELKGDDGASLEDWLRRAYVSWKLAIVEQESFGGKSFWYDIARCHICKHSQLRV